jgi:hypothetical protein
VIWEHLFAGMRPENTSNGPQGGSKVFQIIRSQKRAAIRAEVRDGLRKLIDPQYRDPRRKEQLVVQITRIGVGKMDPWDGLRTALKPVLDGIADAFGTRDDNPRFTWCEPQQTKAGQGVYHVRVRIEMVGVEEPGGGQAA